MIEASAGNVAEGSKLVGEAGSFIEEIVVAVQKVTEAVGQIAQFEEQAAALLAAVGRFRLVQR